MSEHSTDELKRQLEQAMSVLKQAKTKAYDARVRYDLSMCRDKLAEFEALGGVLGVTRVRVGKWNTSDKIDMTRGPFIVTGAYVSYGKTVFSIAKIKLNGGASQAASGADCARIFILPEDQPSTPAGAA